MSSSFSKSQSAALRRVECWLGVKGIFFAVSAIASVVKAVAAKELSSLEYSGKEPFLCWSLHQ